VATRIPLLICIAAVLAVGVRSSRAGDIVVRVEVADSNEKSDPVPVLTIETLAGASGHFSTKTTVAKKTVVLKGDLKKSDDGVHRLHLSFSSNGDDGSQEITTSIMTRLNKPQEIGRLESQGGQRLITLTLEDAPVPAKN
jgi:hypothetical protein